MLSFISFAQWVIISGSVIAWVLAIGRCARGEPLYRFQPRQAVPWGLVDLAVVAVISLGFGSIAVLAVQAFRGIAPGTPFAKLEPDDMAAVMLASSTASIAVFAAVLAWLVIRVGAKASDLGIDPKKADTDVALGMLAYVMLVVPVFAIQLTLNELLPTDQEHPLMTMLKDEPSPWFLLIGGFVAVVVAPIAEEYFFRVILQGWLENLANRCGDVTYLLMGGRRARPTQPQTEAPPQDPILAEPWDQDSPAARDDAVSNTRALPEGEFFALSEPLERIESPYSPPAELPAPAAEPIPVPTDAMKPALWPILLASAVFAALHIGHGHAPIPLFFLAVGLGYLYQRTHRVLPCIIVHMALNASSLLLLWTVVRSVGSGRY